MDNFEIFLDQVKIYQEIERRRKFKKYSLIFGVFFFLASLIYYLYF